jgi:stage II sporulation protein AA (anti-sigma F factor antagonist)
MSAGPAGVPEPFGITLEPHRETIVAKAKGEIDMHTAGRLGEQLHQLLDAGFERVVLDLRAVEFIDSSGLRAILEMHATSRDTGVEFALIQGSINTQRLFEISGAGAELEFVDERELA